MRQSLLIECMLICVLSLEQVIFTENLQNKCGKFDRLVVDLSLSSLTSLRIWDTCFFHAPTLLLLLMFCRRLQIDIEMVESERLSGR